MTSLFDKKLESATVITELLATSCGQRLQWFVNIVDGVIVDIAFQAEVTQLSYKALDVLCAYATGRHIDDMCTFEDELFISLLEVSVVQARKQEIIELLESLKKALEYSK